MGASAKRQLELGAEVVVHGDNVRHEPIIRYRLMLLSARDPPDLRHDDLDATQTQRDLATPCATDQVMNFDQSISEE